jgi:branched-chain amino acid transport system ATP-binding protein
MTVLENVLLGGQDNPGESVIQALANDESVKEYRSKNRERAEHWLKKLEIWEHRDQFAGNLSGGQRRLLELARALMADPDILLLDEPMAGVNPSLTETLVSQIRTLRDEEDLTFLIVEHDLDLIMSLSDRIIAMHNGGILAKGPPKKVKNDDELLEAYLGGGAA